MNFEVFQKLKKERVAISSYDLFQQRLEQVGEENAIRYAELYGAILQVAEEHNAKEIFQIKWLDILTQKFMLSKELEVLFERTTKIVKSLPRIIQQMEVCADYSIPLPSYHYLQYLMLEDDKNYEPFTNFLCQLTQTLQVKTIEYSRNTEQRVISYSLTETYAHYLTAYAAALNKGSDRFKKQLEDVVGLFQKRYKVSIANTEMYDLGEVQPYDSEKRQRALEYVLSMQLGRDDELNQFSREQREEINEDIRCLFNRKEYTFSGLAKELSKLYNVLDINMP